MIQQLFGALSIPGFRPFMLNGLISPIGWSASNLVQSWLVLSLSNDSALWVGVSVALNGVGRLIFSVVAGVLSDQLDRRRVVFVAQLLNGIVAVGMAVATYSGIANLPLALLASFVMGAIHASELTVSAALTYDLAGPQRLLNAAAMRRIATLPTMVLGSLLMGVLLAEVGTWAAYAVVALLLGAAPWLLLWLPATVHTEHRVGQGTGFFRMAAEGLRYGATNPPVRTLLTVSVGMEAFGFSYHTMVPVVAKEVLEVGAIGAGQLAAASGVGSGIAILAVAALGNFRDKPRLVFGCAVAAGLSLIAFSVSRDMRLSLVLALLTTGFLTAYDVTLASLLQIVAPASMRGRVVSLYNLAIAFMSLGGFATGALGTLVGVPTMLAVGGAAIVTNLLAQRRRLLRVREETA
jgi:MFS family permease